MKSDVCKIRIYWPSRWLASVAARPRPRMSAEFEKTVADHGLGPCRVQSYGTFVTVIWERAQDAVWFKLLDS